MTRAELERYLAGFLARQPVDRVRILENSSIEFQVELVLKPQTAITERFILQLESALGQRIGSLSLFRVRGRVFLLRFAVECTADDNSGTDSVQEMPDSYAGALALVQTAISHRAAA
jgi:hypothetical protein